MFDEKVFNSENRTRDREINWINDGIYYLHYVKWLNYFPPEQMYFFNGENFMVDPYNQMKKLEKFLNLEPFIQKDHFGKSLIRFKLFR